MVRGAATAWALVLFILGLLACAIVLALQPWFPETVSLHGRGVQAMLDYTLVATGGFFLAGHLALAYFIVRGTWGSKRVSAEPTWRAEWLPGLLPALVMAVVAEGGIVILGLPVWAQYYAPPPADAFTVEVTARQFFWVVRYAGPDNVFGRTSPALISIDNPIGLDRSDAAAADDAVALNDLHLPANRPVRVTLRSTDVLHSFFVRELRVKQDAVPGMAIPVSFTATRPGDYEIACNQICGLGHYRMRGFLHLMDEAAFRKWLAEQEPFFGTT